MKYEALIFDIHVRVLHARVPYKDYYQMVKAKEIVEIYQSRF